MPIVFRGWGAPLNSLADVTCTSSKWSLRPWLPDASWTKGRCFKSSRRVYLSTLSDYGTPTYKGAWPCSQKEMPSQQFQLSSWQKCVLKVSKTSRNKTVCCYCSYPISFSSSSHDCAWDGQVPCYNRGTGEWCTCWSLLSLTTPLPPLVAICKHSDWEDSSISTIK